MLFVSNPVSHYLYQLENKQFTNLSFREEFTSTVLTFEQLPGVLFHVNVRPVHFNIDPFKVFPSTSSLQA